MASIAKRKEYPISMRLHEADVAMIDRAAVRAAEDELMENLLSPEGVAKFMEVLAAPAAPVPEMVELSKRPAPWEAGFEPKRRAVVLSASEMATPTKPISTLANLPSVMHSSLVNRWARTTVKSGVEALKIDATPGAICC